MQAQSTRMWPRVSHAAFIISSFTNPMAEDLFLTNIGSLADVLMLLNNAFHIFYFVSIASRAEQPTCIYADNLDLVPSHA